MSRKQASASVSSAQGGDRGPGRVAFDVLVAVGFPVLAVGYLVLYLRGDLPELRGEFDRDWLRGWLLWIRTVLPDATAAAWFGTPPSFTLLDRWPVLGLATAIIAAGWLTGRAVLSAFRPRRQAAENDVGTAAGTALTPLERFLFACGIGLNAISLYMLALGLAGAMNRWLLIVPAICVAAWSLWQFASGRAKAPSGQTQSQPALTDDGISARWLWLAAPFVAAIVLGGMLPPMDFDVREYHLQAPKEFYQNGKIAFLPHNVYGNMPLGAEMFSLMGMVLLGDWWLGALVGKTVIAAFAPLTALALFAAGRRFASSGAGVIAAVLYLSIPWVSVVSASGLIEGVLAFYLLMSFYAVLLWRQWPVADGATPRGSTERDLYLAVAGFCSGGAVSCKYPAAVFVAAPLLLYVACTSGKRCLKPLGIFSLALLAGCGLWFAKNWELTGNPVYPLLYEWFGGETRTAEINERWLRAHSPHGFTLTALASSLSAVVLKSSWISPVLVPLAAVGLLVRRYRGLALALAGYFAYIIAAWWLFTHRIDRFWIPALPLLALLAGLGAVWSVSLAWRRLVFTYVIVGLAISFIYDTSPELSYNAYFVSLPGTRVDDRRVQLWHLALNEQVPPGAKVLSVGDAQVFDLTMPVIYNTAFDKNLAGDIFEGRGADQISAELHGHNVSHVYVNWLEIYRYRQPGNYGGVPDFITPDWFAGLVRQGVLDIPWEHPMLPGRLVYPVTMVGETAAVNDPKRIMPVAGKGF